jgi:hypothetical protein
LEGQQEGSVFKSSERAKNISVTPRSILLSATAVIVPNILSFLFEVTFSLQEQLEVARAQSALADSVHMSVHACVWLPQLDDHDSSAFG